MIAIIIGAILGFLTVGGTWLYVAYTRWPDIFSWKKDLLDSCKLGFWGAVIGSLIGFIYGI